MACFSVCLSHMRMQMAQLYSGKFTDCLINFFLRNNMFHSREIKCLHFYHTKEKTLKFVINFCINLNYYKNAVVTIDKD